MHTTRQNMVTLKEVIDDYLKGHSISMRELADRANVSPNTISRWASEEFPNNPDVPALIRLARVLGYDPLVLIEIAYADQLKTDQTEVSAKVLATRIVRLPKFIRDGLEKLIDAYLKQV